MGARRPETRSAAGAAVPCDAARRIAQVLGGGDARVEHGDGWVHTRFTVGGRGVPLGVDVLADTRRAPVGIAFLLPGGGLNFAANFFTPRARNLAHHLRGTGLLVVGIDPREDLATAADITADWGLAAHARDARSVIDAVTGVLPLPHQFVGHSAGAVLALDLASTDTSHRLRRVVALDTTGPYTGDLAVRAAQSRTALQGLIDQGTCVNDPGLKGLLARAVADPGGASSVPWPPGAAARFTNAGLAHFALIRTSSLPGPTSWIYRQGFSAGTYEFGASPADDRFALDRTPPAVWAGATAALGSGLVPNALLRDLMSVWAADGTGYTIDWAGIRAEVVWVNMELGRGDHPRGAELIRAGGNDRVGFRVVAGYGHADPVWGTTAATDVWPLLTPA
ncbi:hypothetical protein ACIBCO_20535 [Streptomyces violascens]|uniref:hypothetical protein n=1 Tax=Streptomyces violascens TaxID=67381 RepID=UPI003794BC9B